MSVLGVLLAILLAALDQTIVATALPRVVADLGGFDQFAWVFTAYMLASTASIPVMGKLSDIYGRKWLLMAGIVVFLIGSGLSGAAQNMTQLILFRGLQGLGAGSIIANSYAVVGDVFPPVQRGKWIGVIGSVFAIAIIAGPLAGGFVTDHLTWRWIFFVNIPIGLVALVVIMKGMVNIRDPQVKRSLDVRGVATLVASVVSLLLALTLAGREYPWNSPEVIGLFSFSFLMALLFVKVEGSAEEPVIPRSLFRNPIFTVATIATFLTAIGMFGGILFIPMFVQGVIGSSATNAGLTLVPMMLSGVVTAVIAGQIISRTGRYRLLGIASVAVMTAGAYMLTRLDSDSSTSDAIVAVVVAGAGLGGTLPTFMIAVQNAFPHHKLGVVTASIQFSRNMGGAVGTAVLGSFMAIRLGNRLTTSVEPEQLEVLPPEVVNKLTDAQTLVHPDTMDDLRALAEQAEGGTVAFVSAVDSLRTALGAAMNDVFLLGFGIIAFALLVTLFFKEIPLRDTMETATEVSSRKSD